MKSFVHIALLGLFITSMAMLGCSTNTPEAVADATSSAKPKGSLPAVVVGYQSMLNPWKVGIQSGSFEQTTGRKIEWRKFNSGSEVITAMASGDVQIAVAGSSPIATAMSRGVEVSLFWIVEAIRENEALVARNGSGIQSMEDLKGKTIGVPFASTTHYHLFNCFGTAQHPDRRG